MTTQLTDITPPSALLGKMRREWGLRNLVSPANNLGALRNDARQQRVRAKIARFVQTAIYPQQLTIPRQYATTRGGVFIYKILENRMVGEYREPGVRVVVQENLQNARFVISPLFSSKQDALDWARSHMGTN